MDVSQAQVPIGRPRAAHYREHCRAMMLATGVAGVK